MRYKIIEDRGHGVDKEHGPYWHVFVEIADDDATWSSGLIDHTVRAATEEELHKLLCAYADAHADQVPKPIDPATELKVIEVGAWFDAADKITPVRAKEQRDVERAKAERAEAAVAEAAVEPDDVKKG